ncbi:MAG TPA: PRC-barrel domain-containing protein [Gemmataceae bacterium]|nr:PRC-barrel domain-containing protein [Gemmataceae bacterium]
MPTVKLHASTIIGAFEEARSEIIGKAVVLTDGKAGTVENIWLDDLHGLRVSIRGHDGKWPISTVKLVQSDRNRL